MKMWGWNVLNGDQGYEFYYRHVNKTRNSLTLLWDRLNRDRNWQLYTLVSFLPRKKEFLPQLFLTLPMRTSLL